MKRVSAREREFVRSELVFLADRLRKLGLTPTEARAFINEMLTVSI